MSTSSFGHVSYDDDDDFMKLTALNVRPLAQAPIYEPFQLYQPQTFQKQASCPVTESAHEHQKQLSSWPKIVVLPKVHAPLVAI